MKGRTVLVTGGAKGIGKATVFGVANAGYNVIVAYNSSEKAAYEIVGELQSREINCGAFRADLTKRQDVENLYEQCKSVFGFVDTVINNAGVCHYNLATCDDYDDYDAVMNANFGSIFGICRLFARDMIDRQTGSIVNLSSVWGARGAATESLYSASKSAIIGYTKARQRNSNQAACALTAFCPDTFN